MLSHHQKMVTRVPRNVTRLLDVVHSQKDEKNQLPSRRWSTKRHRLRDDDAGFGIVWIPGDAAGEREVALENEGQGELELREHEGVEILTSQLGEPVEEDYLDWLEQ